jgi:Ala-tRNA(Pro) deacylase
MVPTKVSRYLREATIPFEVRRHPRAVTAQELAASVKVSGYRVAKSVMLEADGRQVMAVLPAVDVVDIERLATALGALSVRIMTESEFGEMFGGCDLGAEPPFGSLFGVPVVVDVRLARSGPLVVRGGSHEEAIELDYDDFARLEKPRVADFAVFAEAPPRYAEERWLNA